MAKLRVTLVKSTIGRPPRQGKTVKALGLRRLRHTVFHNDTPQIRGMIGAIAHLVDWDLVEE
jgi:large subunit ribosomal protein L30